MPIISQKTFFDLVENYHKNPEKFVFFVGAGLSQPLFPSWAKLLEEFVEYAKEGDLPYDENELLQYIKDGENYLDIAEACVSAIKSTRYRDIMENVFDKDFSIKDIPESYKALMDLSPKTIITTNYDRIPDIAGKGKYRVSTNKNAPEASRFFSNGKNVVFKMHGDITDQSSIVLTTSDYQKIINNNESTRALLNSLLSTKVLIFVGFSLSDPHIDTILERIKSINNNLPISHYILLNEKSSFKISSFENKYGVKIISYTPSDSSHPEVIELLRALNHDTGGMPEQIDNQNVTEISDIDSLLKYMEKHFSDTIVGSDYSIFYESNNVYLSFTPTGETKGEIQKEILSIIKLISFECEIFSNLIIIAIAKTPPSINVDESQAVLLKAKVKYVDAKNYAEKNISTSTMWKLIEFYAPASLSNLLQNEEKIEFPMSTGIVGN